MRIPLWLLLAAALVTAALVVLASVFIVEPPRSLILDAGFAAERMTPNADGSDDIVLFEYGLSRPATVSIVLENENGEVYAFRQDERRAPDDNYQVLFSGVVDGFARAGDTYTGEILQRLIPDGTYTWKLSAVDDAGVAEERTGSLIVAEGDAPLPELTHFTVYPQVFTPNQDGIHDRVQINVVQAKEAELSVYLQDAVTGEVFYIPERFLEVERDQAGRHVFDYEGGVDQGADPPPDGAYLLVAEAQDAVGQKVRVSAELTIIDGGKPQAQIIGQPVGPDVALVTRDYETDYTPGTLVAVPDQPEDLNMNALTLPVGDLLVFMLTIENYSNVPIRTTGPEPGTVYEQTEIAGTLGYLDSSGAWRVGLDCDTAPRDYPWRWAIGTPDNLETVVDPTTGETFYYLPPGERSVVWGAVRMTEISDARNPQVCWAGLIHEDVIVSAINSRVGPREVELVPVPVETE